MSTKAGEAIRELRNIIGHTQGEFAVMIGASKDTVASWEVGRNKLSRSFARRIAFATGVEEEALWRGRVPLTAPDPLTSRRPFTAETFAQHRSSNWGRSDEAAARHHLTHCADALRILFLAAARPSRDQDRQQLPALLESFRQWCEQMREDFRLDEGIEAQLEERKFKLGQTRTYGEWRAMHRKSPAAMEAAGFKDNPTKRDDEELFLGSEAVPAWEPGGSLRGPRPARTRLRPKK
jgi:DNA-binding XRE family transcriptional regulator